MKNLTLKNVAEACKGQYIGAEERENFCVTAVTTDSRQVCDGCLFVAVPGERVDGHSYIQKAVEAGAAAVIAERELPGAAFPYILVKNSLQAVKDLAEFYLAGLGIPVVGIAGSVGKTSTKEMTASVLSQKYRVLKTEGNFNNELGLPLTIFRLRSEDEIAVLEMGISDFGEMHRLSKIARPRTCILTNIGWCHLENLKDRDGILKAKSEIFDYLQPDGQVILNGDDDKLSTIREVKGIIPRTFGLSRRNDVWADQLENRGLSGISCRIHTPEGEFSVLIPKPGEHMVYNALAAAAAGLCYGLTLEEIRSGLESYETISGRFRILETGKYTLIDDCYNANPVSMKASLQALQDGKNRRVAVLGDMGELGEQERELHGQVGAFAGTLSIDALYCAGPLSEELADRAARTNPGLEVRWYPSRDRLMVELPGLLRTGDTVLVKASHYMGFDKIVNLLQAESSQPADQGPEPHHQLAGK